ETMSESTSQEDSGVIPKNRSLVFISPKTQPNKQGIQNDTSVSIQPVAVETMTSLEIPENVSKSSFRSRSNEHLGGNCIARDADVYAIRSNYSPFGMESRLQNLDESQNRNESVNDEELTPPKRLLNR
ncbi:MAG: hypothetical protein ACRCUY_00845, partial [Thermoguttaceae bacterium]